MRKRGRLLCVITAMSFFAGCIPKQDQIIVDESDLLIDFNCYEDSEKIPDWKGEKLELSVWMDADSPVSYVQNPESKYDVVSPEIERITGVVFDSDNSIDNSDMSFDAKITQIVAAGNYPAMAYSLPELSELVKTDALWNLKPYIEKYCPNIMRYYGPNTVFSTIWEEQEKSYGGMYALQIGEYETALEGMVKIDASYNLTDEQISNIIGYRDTPHGYVYVRDDVLKMIYPEAHTVAELYEVYKKNGKFTEAEIFDVPWNKPQDFIDFLYKVNALELPDDGKGQVYTTFTHNGTDNWAPCTLMLSMFGYNTDYFDYYDLADGKIKYTFKQPWFKNILSIYNKLIRDGVASSEALLDTQQNFRQKYSNGRYLVALYNYPPSYNGQNEYTYRKVYARYTNGWDKCLNNATVADGLKKISFFKEGINEQKLIQALRAIDLMCSLPGQKLCYWGTKSAGLYTEDENGFLQYTDKVAPHGVINGDLQAKYGLGRGPRPGRPLCEASPYNPYAFYERPSTLENTFNAAAVDPIEYPVCAEPNIYKPQYTSVLDGAKKFWQARNAFEDSLLQVFAAQNDTQFEERYNAMCDVAERNGLTDELLIEYQKLYEQENKIYDGNIEVYLHNNASRKN